MVKHVVMFKFSGDETERLQTAERFAEALRSLPEKIGQLKSIEVGINSNPKEEWDLVLTAEAETMEDVAAYSAHPAHVAAVALIAGHKAGRACVDYIL